MNEAPKKVEVHFVQNNIDPTGLGEPPFPPVFGAVANALYRAYGKRLYEQPYGSQLMQQAAPESPQATTHSAALPITARSGADAVLARPSVDSHDESAARSNPAVELARSTA